MQIIIVIDIDHTRCLLPGRYLKKILIMKKILIPTDFSENASDALDYALHLIKGQKTTIHIINVIEPIVVSSDIGANTIPVSHDHISNAKKAMEAIEMFSKEYFGETNRTNINITTSVEIGSIAYTINQKAKELETDVIIMGTQGHHHSFLEKVIGTISTDVIDNAVCPVILIPKGYKFKIIDNVIFSTNLNHADPYKLWKATEILAPMIVKVRCLYVSPDKSKEDIELERFAKYMVEHSPSLQTVFNVVESDSVESKIIEYADTYNAELVIMHKDKKAHWRRIFTTSHTRKMVFWTRVPLMILN